jgi:phage repressor protein C with HTH and peptisase S24 domain
MMYYSEVNTPCIIHSDTLRIMSTMHERLEKARKLKYRARTDAARAIGVPVSTYVSNENGTRAFGRERAVQYARHLGVSVDWLLSGRGEMQPANTGVSLDVPLVSWVSAGPLVLADAVEEYADATRVVGPDLDAGGDWIALEVDGDSMNKISPPGSIIFVNRKDRRLVPNACYVIADETGAATYKRWRPDTGWGPVSTNDDHAPLKLRAGAEPTIIGRVKLSLIRM